MNFKNQRLHLMSYRDYCTLDEYMCHCLGKDTTCRTEVNLGK